MEVSGYTCPRCGNPKVKKWDELDEDQKFLVERLPDSADHTFEERKKHRFCTRCWFENTQEFDRKA